MGQLNGKVVVITGASSGIGRAAALSFALRGARVFLAARRAEKLQAVAREAMALGGEATAVACDVSKPGDVETLFAAAMDKHGRVDVAVANAGYGLLGRLHEATEEQMQDIWRVNVLGTWYVMKRAAEIMLPQKSGHIIAVSSAIARRALPQMGPYAMTKAAQLSLVEAQRVELMPFGIKVSSVHPTTTATEFFDQASIRSGRKMCGFGSVQTAELVGDKIAQLAEHPRPELWPSRLTRISLAFASLLPSMTDRALAKMTGKNAAMEKRRTVGETA